MRATPYQTAARSCHQTGLHVVKAKVIPHRADWQQPPLRRYKWSQLKLVDDIVCREYSPFPGSDVISVPVLPVCLHCNTLHCNHNICTAGHQGFDKTLQCLKQEAYWVNMARDVDAYCRQCTICQQAKLPTPTRALANVPIGRPWEMIVVDIFGNTSVIPKQTCCARLLYQVGHSN